MNKQAAVVIKKSVTVIKSMMVVDKHVVTRIFYGHSQKNLQSQDKLTAV